jgi:hypothetical protein
MNSVDSIRNWKPVECTVPAPVLTDIVGEHTVEQWCQNDMSHLLLRCASPFETAAAVGLLGRFWRPKDGETQKAVDAAVAGKTPGCRAKEWWNSLPQEAKQQIVQAALMRVDDLVDDLPCLRKGWVDAYALDFLYRRDNLESVLFLLNGTPEADALRGALRDLDDEAAHLYVAWAPELKDDDRLCAVATEPGAWWPKGAK